MGALPLPRVDGKFALVNVGDVALTAAMILRSHLKHGRLVYSITGPRLVSCADLAASASKILEMNVSYLSVALTTAKRLLSDSGVSNWIANSYLVLFDLTASGQMDITFTTFA